MPFNLCGLYTARTLTIFIRVMKNLASLYTLLLAFFCVANLAAQVNYTANNRVVPYTGRFRPGVNMGYYPQWTNQQLADISAGNPSIGQKGVGSRTVRTGVYEIVLDYFGYNLVKPDFAYYDARGMGEHVAIVGGPAGRHQDYATQYCPGQFSALFANMYAPIWDGGANGTPYNDDNYFAAYMYKVVSTYKDDVRFWEVWNEPGLDYANIGWRGPDYPGNWWLEGPQPCQNILNAPLYHYIRTMRIAWEVIKTVDPDSYVCLGSVGYQSMLNAILRNTDNPQAGDVSPAYPLTGGAYFDCISYHTYPHFDGSTTNYDLNFFERHSDEAADGVYKYRDYYQAILNQYGYDGVSYPKKEWIVTEANAPRKAFTGQYFAGYDQQINYLLKTFMIAKINKIHQMHWFQLFDQKTDAEATFEFHLMGLYKKIDGITAYGQQVNDEGIAAKTVSDLIYNTEYDPAATAALRLPPSVRGYAFRRPDGSYVYALWARTTEDLSETANATYSFSPDLQFDQITRYAWDWGYTNQTTQVSADNIRLDGRPIFFTATPPAPSCSISAVVSDVICNNNGTPGNKEDDTFTFGLMVTGTGVSNGWRGTVGTTPISGTYGQKITAGPFSVRSDNLALLVRDNATSTCTTAETVTSPGPCSNGNPPPPPTGVYCASKSDFPWHDWISRVQLANLNNASEKSQYSDFTAQSATLTKGQPVTLTLTTAYSWNAYAENWKVWIDYNQNTVFEANEMAYSGAMTAPADGTPEKSVTGSITVPANALAGTTRMRVSMSRDANATPCSTLTFGEVEDYTVVIGGQLADNIDFFEVSKQSGAARLDWALPAGFSNATVERSTDGVRFAAIGQVIDAATFTDAQPADGANWYRVKATNAQGKSTVSPSRLLRNQRSTELSLYPNPARDRVMLDLAGFSLQSELHIVVYNNLGVTVVEHWAKPELPLFNVSLAHLPAGQYRVRVQAADGQSAVKGLVIR